MKCVLPTCPATASDPQPLCAPHFNALPPSAQKDVALATRAFRQTLVKPRGLVKFTKNRAEWAKAVNEACRVLGEEELRR